MKYFIIYKITNNVNGKLYVGKHETNKIDDSYFGSGVVLKQAINKYGTNNFKKEILEYCDNKENLNEREVYWIKELNTICPNGYNINKGGKGGDNFTNNPNKEKILENLKTLNIGRKASNETKVNMSKKRLGVKIKSCKIVICPHCNKSGDIRNMIRWHFDNCLKNIENNENKRNLKKVTCPYCLGEYTYLNASIDHFDYCKLNPNRILRDYSYKKNNEESIKKMLKTKKNNGYIVSEETKEKTSKALTGIKRSNEFIEKQKNNMIKRWKNKKEIFCPHCQLKSTNVGNMNRWHFDNCKLKVLD